MRKQGKSFVSGFVLALVLMCGVNMVTGSGASATNAKKTVSISYKDIKICIDGQTITPKDANGKTVEPFILDGTTYLPIRAVGSALGKAVDYDGTTHTVYLGTKPAASTTDDSAKFVGKWEAKVDLTDMLNKQLASDPATAGLADYFKVKDYVLTLNFTFGSDGTYQIAIDRAALKKTTDELLATLKAGMLDYAEDLLEEQAKAYGISVEDVLKAAGADSVEGFLTASGLDLDEIFDADTLLNAYDNVESKGAYTAKDGQLSLTDSTDETVDVELYEFTSATQVKLKDQTGTSPLGDIVLNKK